MLILRIALETESQILAKNLKIYAWLWNILWLLNRPRWSQLKQKEACDISLRQNLSVGYVFVHIYLYEHRAYGKICLKFTTLGYIECKLWLNKPIQKLSNDTHEFISRWDMNLWADKKDIVEEDGCNGLDKGSQKWDLPFRVSVRCFYVHANKSEDSEQNFNDFCLGIDLYFLFWLFCPMQFHNFEHTLLS